MNVPKLRFKDDDGREFPEWEKMALGEVGEIITGKTPSTSDEKLWDGEILFVTPTDISDNKYQYKTQRTVVQTEKLKVLPKHSIMFTCIASIGKMSLSIFPCITNQQINSLVPKAKFDNEYVFYALLSISDFIKSTQANTTLPIINKTEFSKFVIPIPAKKEQTKIANFLTAVDEKISFLTQKSDLLTQYKKGVMQKIFSQELRFKDDDGRDFPEWDLKDGGDIFDSVTNKNHNSDLPILAITQEYGAIPRDLIEYQISVTDKSVESYKVVEIGDFIISLRSFQGGIEYSKYKGICSPAYIILRPKQKIVDDFYKYFLKTEGYIKSLSSKLEGIRDGKMVSYKYFSEIQLPCPCEKEQTKIANFLTAIDDKITQTQAELDAVEQYKQGLLQQMFV